MFEIIVPIDVPAQKSTGFYKRNMIEKYYGKHIFNVYLRIKRPILKYLL